MEIKRDGSGQPYVEWAQSENGFKRVWIQRRTEPVKDWAGTGRYLNVVRIEGLGRGPAGAPTDFPVASPLPDEEVLVAFVHAVSAITGRSLKSQI